MADTINHIFHVQDPSRKKVRLGDVFVAKLDEGFLHGRVVNLAALSSSYSTTPMLLLYFYQGLSISPEVFPTESFSPPKLIIPPVITNTMGWRRGYFQTIGNIELTPDQLLSRHVFRGLGHESEQFWDEYNSPVHSATLSGHQIGIKALDSYLTIEDSISRALGKGPTIEYH